MRGLPDSLTRYMLQWDTHSSTTLAVETSPDWLGQLQRFGARRQARAGARAVGKTFRVHSDDNGDKPAMNSMGNRYNTTPAQRAIRRKPISV